MLYTMGNFFHINRKECIICNKCKEIGQEPEWFTKNDNLANLIDIGFNDEHKVDKYGFTIYKSTPRPIICFIYTCSFGHTFTIKS